MKGPDVATRPQSRQEASYELVTHLATGGMAELFIARRHGDPTAAHVVLKRVMPEQAKNPHFVGMFLDEARLASRLNHPNIAQVLDVGRAGSSYYYTMEYVHGENVRDLLQLAVKRQVLVPLDVCLSILIGAAIGLHAAHETRDRHGVSLGIVHRDVSPSNVMISYAGAIKLVDFGVAKAADHTTETQSGTVKGKIAYLSPEQCTIQAVDRRSDVFSLGIVAYELVTRSRLFRRRSDYETMHAIVNDPVPAPSRHRADVPPAIDLVIARALARSPEQRPQSAAELAEELAVVAAGLGLATGPEVLARFMGELFGARPLPWAHLDHHDTAVIALAALAPGLAASELEPLEDSVSAAEAVIEVDQVTSSSVDQAFAQVITTIAPPPREWGVGDEVPGVFTWPSRDEGIDGVDRTVMTSAPARGRGSAIPRIPPPPARVPVGTPSPPARMAGGGFLPTDTVVTPPRPRGAGDDPEVGDAREAPVVGEPGATIKFGRVGWLDEVATTITERTTTQRMAAAAAAAGRGEAMPAAPGPRDTIVDDGPRDTVRDLGQGPAHRAVDVEALRRLVNQARRAPAEDRRRPATGPAPAPASAPAPTAAGSTTAPPVAPSPAPAIAAPPVAPSPLATRATAPSTPVAKAAARSSAATTHKLVPNSSPRLAPPAAAPGPSTSAQTISLPKAGPDSPLATTLELNDAAEVMAKAWGPAGPTPEPADPLDQRTTTPRTATRPPRTEAIAPPPMAWPPVDPRTGHHGGADLILPGLPPPDPESRRALVVVGLGLLAGVGLALVVGLALRSPDRTGKGGGAVGGAVVAPGGSAGGGGDHDVDAIRTRARAARSEGRWADAYGLCRDGLQLATDDVELAAICAHAACAAREPEAASRYVRLLPATHPDAELARRRCLDLGVADPSPP